MGGDICGTVSIGGFGEFSRLIFCGISNFGVIGIVSTFFNGLTEFNIGEVNALGNFPPAVDFCKTGVIGEIAEEKLIPGFGSGGDKMELVLKRFKYLNSKN